MPQQQDHSEDVTMNETVLRIITDYFEEEELLSKEESQRFQKIWRKER